MSSGRYWGAIVLAIGSCIALTVFFMSASFEFFESILLGLCLGAAVGELIFWDTLPMRLAKFLLIISVIPLQFAFGMLCSGLVGFIIGLMIVGPCFVAFATCVGAAIGLAGLLSLVCFPIHIFTMRDEVY